MLVDDENVFYLAQALNFISPIFFFRSNFLLINRAALIVFSAYFVIGCLQWFGLLTFLEPIMQFFVSRFKGSTWGAYRGVSMLETEPARASYQMLMLYIVGRPIGRYFSSLDYTMIAVLFFSQLVLIRSTTGLLFSTALVGIIFLSKLEFKASNVVAVAILVFSLVAIAPLNPKIAAILSMTKYYGLMGLYDGLAATSGGRFLGLVNSIQDIFRWPLGYGADPSYFGSLQAGLDRSIVVEGYLTHVGNRAVSAPVVFTRTFGILFLFALFYILKRSTPLLKLNRYSFFIFLLVTAYSPPGSEIALMAVLMATLWDTDINPSKSSFKRKNLSQRVI